MSVCAGLGLGWCRCLVGGCGNRGFTQTSIIHPSPPQPKPRQAGVEPNAVVYEKVEEACRVAGRLDKLVGLKWDR